MLLKYLNWRRRLIYLLIFILAFFTLSWYLFDLPAVTILYPLCLSISMILLAGFFDFWKMRRKWRDLQLLRQEQGQAENDQMWERSLPEAESWIEEEYQSILKAQQKAEKMLRSQFASDYNNMMEYYTVWAHQIKTPIASMRLSLQAEDSAFARRISGDLNRIEAYVEMVLTFLRLDSDSTDYVIKEQDLDKILRTCIRKFSREFISKKLTMHFQPTNQMILTDEKWFSFVIEQMISNAVKYTSEGGVRIYMPEPYLLCIEDTGIGICAEDLPRVFENGYTGFNGREDKRATGIGLYLCRRICDNLGHKIRAESQQGVGTKIFLDVNMATVKIE